MISSHSLGGLIKRLEISTAGIFVFVEGKDIDVRFYDKIFIQALNGELIKHEVILLSRYLKDFGGKPGLLKLYDMLKADGKINFQFRGKKKSILFMLDKDIDEVLELVREDENLIYTEHYCSENYLILYNDIKSCIMNSCQIPSSEIGSIDNSVIDNIRSELRPWVTHCVAAGIGEFYKCCGYGHPPPKDFRVTDLWKEDIIQKSGKSKAEVDQVYMDAYAIVDRCYSNGKFDKLLKGKWYFNEIESVVKRHFSDFNIAGFQKSLQTAMLVSLEMKSEWLDHFYNGIKPAMEFISNTTDAVIEQG